MSVTRINEFQAQDGQGDALRDLLGSFVAAIESSAGCRSCQLLQSEDDPTRIVVIEVWESPEAHQAAVESIPTETFDQARELLAGPPKGAYYRG